jgi:hypothetical protein
MRDDQADGFRLLEPDRNELLRGCVMAIGRAERMAERRPRVIAVCGDALASPVLEVLELTELAWHDCYGEIAPPERIIDDILFCSGGDMVKLIHAALLAVKDRRDLQLWAEQLKTPSNPA